jgi:hypothetical protein
VHTIATGIFLLLDSPRAKKAAERSSNMGMVSIWGCLAKAKVSGLEREPGDITAKTNPKRERVSTITQAQSVLTLEKSKLVILSYLSRVISNSLEPLELCLKVKGEDYTKRCGKSLCP